jgi:uncharacterized protein (TIGR00730 family)
MTSNTNNLTEGQFLQLQQIQKEFEIAMNLTKNICYKTVAFYGGANLGAQTSEYKDIYKMAVEFGKLGWGVITGGGPGVMTAGLEGVKKGGGKALSFRINIEGESPIIIGDIDYAFEHFAPRKFALRQADVYIYCPGSIGTLDELMENWDLMKTNKMPTKPIFLYDSAYWKGLIKWVDDVTIEKWHLGKETLMEFVTIVDTADEIMLNLIQK